MHNRFDFDEITRQALSDPLGFVQACDAVYQSQIQQAAERICNGVKDHPILLLSGPSGSGKTTSAKKVEIALKTMGVHTHVVSMDNYFRTVDLATHPRDEYGGIDYESPDCMDIPLLNRHLDDLAEGREIMVPKFEFAKQARNDARAVPLRLGRDEVAVMEGIHAFNPAITGSIGDRALKLYVSARSSVVRDEDPFYFGTWMRLTRRLIRDKNFRGAGSEHTLKLWASVRRGERKFISPYKDHADIIIDTALPYELCVLKKDGVNLLSMIPEDCERGDEWARLAPCLAQFPDIEEALVAGDSLMREFIGGGVIKY